MTTYGHTGLAICVYVLTSEAPLEVKLAACAGLAISHLPADAIPHRHWYNYKDIQVNLRDQLGALVELFGGMIVIPLVLSLVLHWNFLLLMAYVLSASLLDILVGLRFPGTERLNRAIHWWDRKVPVKTQVAWETAQTIAVYSLAVFLASGPF